MSQVNTVLIKVPENWTLLSTLITNSIGTTFTWDTSKTYLIEARGQGSNEGGTLLITATTAPTDDTVNAGNFIDNNGFKCVSFKKGTGDLYVKLFRSSLESFLTISIMEE